MISVDSNAPYTSAFGSDLAPNAVYLTATDPILGKVLAIVYRNGSTKLCVVLLGNHGTSGYVDITLDASSRFFGACRSLAPAHYNSPVRRALAMAVLRTYNTMDRPLLRFLIERATSKNYAECEYMHDENAAGVLGSSFKLVFGKLPGDIGGRVIEAGVLTKKDIFTSVIDVVYKDSDETIDEDNELVYSLGSQLEQLFNPLTEYSPEPTEQLYAAPRNSTYTLEDDPQEAQSICEELYLVQSHLRADLIDFHENFLVPLRIAVLRNEIPELTISRLNTIFPPTFDEVLRINNLFYVALQEALPYGSFEVLRACGITLPYFFRALMRHEAATQDFTNIKNINVPEFNARMEEYGPSRIDSVVRSSLNLAKFKLLLDRLASSEHWPEDQLDIVRELHGIAVSTVDSFGRAHAPQEKYERRTLTPSGKLLSELTTGWPSELEYGWMQNRRVVAIFDGEDVLEENRTKKNLHHIMVLFTDILIILQPQRPIPMTSISGLRIPYVGDMLMHSLLNQVPLDHNLPQLKVVAWAPISSLTFASYNEDRYINIISQPNPFRIGRDNYSDKNLFAKCYKLTQPDHSAKKLGEILAKTKISTKLQDLHIFKFETEEEAGLSIFATVHELQHYINERTRFPICIFMNQEIDYTTLEEFGLDAAVAVKFAGEAVSVHVVTKYNYSSHKNVPWSSYRYYVITEVCYLMTLQLSSQNDTALNSIVATNLRTVNKLIAWAQAPSDAPVRGHKRHPNMSRDMRTNNILSPVSEETPGLTGTGPSQPPRRPQPLAGHAEVASASSSSGEGPVPLRTPGAGPAKLRKKERFLNDQNRERSYRDLAKRPSIASYGVGRSGARGPSQQSIATADSANETAIIYRYGDATVSDFGEYDDELENSWESIDNDSRHQEFDEFNTEDEAEQRDVDDWFHNLDEKDGQSLSTSMSDAVISDQTHSRSSSKNTQHSDVQIGGFIQTHEYDGYDGPHEGEAYDAIHSRNPSDVSAFSQASGVSQAASESSAVSHGSRETRQSDVTVSSRMPNTTSRNSIASSRIVSQDYSWLAGMVEETELTPARNGASILDPQEEELGRSLSTRKKRSSSRNLYSSLRESSIMDLSAYLRTSDTSQSLDFMAMLQNDRNDVLGSNEATPKLT